MHVYLYTSSVYVCVLCGHVLTLTGLSYSYHQKYLLRQQRDVLKALNLTDEELITSHAAARLNGYCGGNGSVEELEKELPSFALPSNIQDRVRRLVSRGSFH